MRLAEGDDRGPDAFDEAGRGDNLKPILPGIAGTRSPDIPATALHFGDLILFQVCRATDGGATDGRAGETLIDEFADARALDGHSAGCIGRISQAERFWRSESCCLFFEPGDVVINARGI